MFKHRRVPLNYFFFFLPFAMRGSCFLTRSTSRRVQARNRFPPMCCTEGAETLPAAMYRCMVIRLMPKSLAASRVE